MLFQRKKTETESTEANFKTAVQFFAGLGHDEYKKALKVVKIRRKSDEDSAKVLDMELEPTTFINGDPFLDDMLLSDEEGSL